MVFVHSTCPFFDARAVDPCRARSKKLFPGEWPLPWHHTPLETYSLPALPDFCIYIYISIPPTTRRNTGIHTSIGQDSVGGIAWQLSSTPISFSLTKRTSASNPLSLEWITRLALHLHQYRSGPRSLPSARPLCALQNCNV